MTAVTGFATSNRNFLVNYQPLSIDIDQAELGLGTVNSTHSNSLLNSIQYFSFQNLRQALPLTLQCMRNPIVRCTLLAVKNCALQVQIGRLWYINLHFSFAAIASYLGIHALHALFSNIVLQCVYFYFNNQQTTLNPSTREKLFKIAKLFSLGIMYLQQFKDEKSAHGQYFKLSNIIQVILASTVIGIAIFDGIHVSTVDQFKNVIRQMRYDEITPTASIENINRLNHTDCPITLTPILEIQQPVFLKNATDIYSFPELKHWLILNLINPTTRQAVQPQDIVKISREDLLNHYQEPSIESVSIETVDQ